MHHRGAQFDTTGRIAGFWAWEPAPVAGLFTNCGGMWNQVMGEVVNLRTLRKRAERRSKEQRASEHRATYGRGKADRSRADAQRDRARKDLDQHRLDTETIDEIPGDQALDRNRRPQD